MEVIYLLSVLISLWWNIDGSCFIDDELDGGCAVEFLWKIVRQICLDSQKALT